MIPCADLGLKFHVATMLLLFWVNFAVFYFVLCTGIRICATCKYGSSVSCQ